MRQQTEGAVVAATLQEGAEARTWAGTEACALLYEALTMLFTCNK
jgi:hypothetical protein